LPFGDVVSESFGFFFTNIRLFFHLVTIPWIASLALRVVGDLIALDSAPAALLEKAVDVIPTVMFMVGWQRVVLLGPHRLERLPGTGWSPRETAYLGHLAKVAGMTFVLVSVFMITVWPMDPAAIASGAPLDPEMARRYAFAGPLAFGFILSLLLALRVSWGLAASAIDVPFSPRLSWAFSRGNGWTIIAALFFIYFGGAFVTAAAALLAHGVMAGVLGANEAAAVVSWTVAILVSYGALAITATAEAVIFRRLLGWREGTALPTVTEA
jgi:hypothetical protein